MTTSALATGRFLTTAANALLTWHVNWPRSRSCSCLPWTKLCKMTAQLSDQQGKSHTTTSRARQRCHYGCVTCNGPSLRAGRARRVRQKGTVSQ